MNLAMLPCHAGRDEKQNKIKFSIYRKSAILAVHGWYSGFFDRSMENNETIKRNFLRINGRLVFQHWWSLY